MNLQPFSLFQFNYFGNKILYDSNIIYYAILQVYVNSKKKTKKKLLFIKL